MQENKRKGGIKRKKAKQPTGCLAFPGTQTRGRTGMDVTPLVFETSASTDSAIWASFFSGKCFPLIAVQRYEHLSNPPNISHVFSRYPHNLTDFTPTAHSYHDR